MNLSSLSLLDLQSLNDILTTLDQCGALIVEHGFDPVFSLSPGLPVTMTLGPLLDTDAASAKADVAPPTPPFTGLASQTEDFGPRLGWDEYDREIHLLGYTGRAHSLGAWGELTLSASCYGTTKLRTYRAVGPWCGLGDAPLEMPFGAVCIRDPETGWTADLPIEPLPEAAPVALQHVGAGASAPPVTATEAPDAIDPPRLSASGVSGQARPVAPTDKFQPAPWSEIEDKQAVAIAACHAFDGRGLRSGAQAVADAIGRPYEGTHFRLRNKLKPALEIAVQGLQNLMPRPAPQDDAPLVAIPPQGSDALTVHLLGVPRKGGWTMAMDQQLMDLACAGWKEGEIAADMGLSSAKDVKTRFDLLTGLTETLDGNKKRTYERDLVRLRLDDLIAEAKINLVVAAMKAGTAAAE